MIELNLMPWQAVNFMHLVEKRHHSNAQAFNVGSNPTEVRFLEFIGECQQRCGFDFKVYQHEMSYTVVANCRLQLFQNHIEFSPFDDWLSAKLAQVCCDVVAAVNNVFPWYQGGEGI